MTLSATLEHNRNIAGRGHQKKAVELRFSRALWGIDWSDHLPLTITTDGIIVAESSFEETVPFVRENMTAMFEEDPSTSPFLQSSFTPAKTMYYAKFGDFFEFKDDGRTVGILVCTPVDWTSYYIRFCAFL